MTTSLNLEALPASLRDDLYCLPEALSALGNKHAEKRQLNSFISYAPDAFTPARQEHQAGALRGVTVSFKDNINVCGMATTAGTPGLADFYPDRDASIVQRFRQLGARIIGKNNMHELSFGVTSANHSHGSVVNPANQAQSAGGSSGGCAAAVAAGLVHCAVGTDTGGSVRIPASFCGVVGYRPTTGCYPGDGIVPISATKDSAGLLTRTVQACDFIHRNLKGVPETAIDTQAVVRIGVPEHFLWSDLEDEVYRDCNRAIAKLANGPVELVPINDALLGEINESIQFPLPIYEFFIDFPRFLMKHGLGNRFLGILEAIRDPDIKRLLETQLQSPAISYKDYLQALTSKVSLEQEYTRLFLHHNLDLLAYPTVRCTAPLLDDCANPQHFESFVRNTDIASNLAAPSLTIPVAAADSLPVGLSFDALPGKDGSLLATALHLSSYLSNT